MGGHYSYHITNVTGLCGFGWAGDVTTAVAGVVLGPTRLVYFSHQCGPVPRSSSLDAEMGGCGMLMNNLRQWIDKCGCYSR